MLTVGRNQGIKGVRSQCGTAEARARCRAVLRGRMRVSVSLT